MGFTIKESISAITVFVQGILNFFSPCVLPLLPLYIGYLSGGTVEPGPDGARNINRKKVFINTLFFVLGIGFSFFLLALGMRAVGRFFSGNQQLFARIGGVIVILFGLYQLGLFGSSKVLEKEKRLPFKFNKIAMSPFTALLMGFVFSFAWTPCVGPTLSSVLLMASSASDAGTGFLLVLIYTLGFSVPFLLTGLFTTSLLDFFRKHRSVVRYTVKIGGALLIVMGLLMITGYMNGITGYLSRFASVAESSAYADSPEDTGSASGNDSDLGEMTSGTDESNNRDDNSQTDNDDDKIPAPDFALSDQYGDIHSLSDYRGKVIFLNFWATWCPPCRMEMPDIQALYEEYSANPDSEVVILGVVFPGSNGEENAEGVAKFLKDNGYTYPTLMDEGASLGSQYFITAFPTTFMIDRNGNVFGYVTGSMPKDVMYDIIRQTLEGVMDK